MWLRVSSALVLAAVAAVGGAAAATAPAGGPVASARALAVRIVLADGQVVGSRPATGAAGATAASAATFAYPADGSVVVTGAIRAQAHAQASTAATATAASGAANVSLFDGVITADSASASVSAATSNGRPGGAFPGTGVVHLQALGRAHAYGQSSLGDWGTLTIARHTATRSTLLGAKGYEGVSIALDVRLTAAHGGLPAGSQIEVGYSEAFVRTALPVSGAVGIEPVVGDRPQLLPPTTTPLVGVPQVIEPPLGAATYVYPVYGPSDYSDGYGNSNGGGSFQHGVDLFGQLGQPVLAVAGGTLFSVGWNVAAGNRLWLRDRQGNQFYYAHLSAFSTLTSNGAHVQAGQVIGFMGDTGNANGEPTHLHFEIHPVSMLFLGDDGAVDPGPYLASWRHLVDVSFPVATGWAPAVPGTIKAPEPGAVPIGTADISTADGLDPASLRRALRPAATG